VGDFSAEMSKDVYISKAAEIVSKEVSRDSKVNPVINAEASGT
jgi:hypothetical protein